VGKVSAQEVDAPISGAAAISSVAPGLVALKWPNDVWLKGKKAGGIIAEAVADPAQNLVCVLLGIGLNLNLGPADIPEELQEKATSVRIATGQHCDRIEVAATLLNRLDSRYMEAEAHGFAAIRPDYEGYSALTGKTVTVNDGATRVAGRVSGVDNEGALMLETDRGLRRVMAGEVSVEGAYD
jgi:BirA family biotin operon repressor/biotin-[acetyl-CoA-carboxylase] ligase